MTGAGNWVQPELPFEDESSDADNTISDPSVVLPAPDRTNEPIEPAVAATEEDGSVL